MTIENKLHKLVIKHKRKDFSKVFSWSDSDQWTKVAQKLTNLEFSYKKVDEISAVVGLFHFTQDEDVLLFKINLKIPQIVKPIIDIKTLEADSINEYRCPPQFDNVLEDLSYAICNDLLPSTMNCLLEDLANLN